MKSPEFRLPPIRAPYLHTNLTPHKYSLSPRDQLKQLPVPIRYRDSPLIRETLGLRHGSVPPQPTAMDDAPSSLQLRPRLALPHLVPHGLRVNAKGSLGQAMQNDLPASLSEVRQEARSKLHPAVRIDQTPVLPAELQHKSRGFPHQEDLRVSNSIQIFPIYSIIASARVSFFRLNCAFSAERKPLRVINGHGRPSEPLFPRPQMRERDRPDAEEGGLVRRSHSYA
jgi:hypothetical protein